MGINVSVTVIPVFGAMSVPTAGIPLTLNGAEGSVISVTVMGVAPVLLKVVLAEAGSPPAVTPPKLMGVGATLICPEDDSPVPASPVLNGPADVATFKLAADKPTCVGAKVTGTVMV